MESVHEVERLKTLCRPLFGLCTDSVEPIRAKKAYRDSVQVLDRVSVSFSVIVSVNRVKTETLIELYRDSYRVLYRVREEFKQPTRRLLLFPI